MATDVVIAARFPRHKYTFLYGNSAVCCTADINTARCYGIQVNVYRFPHQAVRLAAAILTFRQPHRFLSSLPPPVLSPRRFLSEVLAFLVLVSFLLNWVYLPFFFFF